MTNLTSSCPQLDYTNCLAGAIGATHGLTDSEMDTLIAKIPKHHENIAELRETKESSWFDSPHQDLTDLHELIAKHTGKWEYIVVIGSGGASLMAKSLIESLCPHHRNLATAAKGKAKTKEVKPPKILFLENTDPVAIEDVISVIDPKKTLFQVICRTGTTVESVGIFLWLIDWLKKNATKTAVTKQILLCTDVERSPLIEITNEEKIPVLPWPEYLGDRYGVFGNYSLFTAALAGVDIEAVLAGARAMEERCWHGDAWSNPAYMHSLIHYLLTRKRRKTIHATMGFSSRLAGAIDWYNHLLGVSLGKMLNRKGKAVHVGPTPSSCLGPSGLHGQMQLYSEGPFDKVTTFIVSDDHGDTIEIPKSFPKIEAVAYLGGSSIESIVKNSYYTAVQEIAESGRPNMTILLDSVNPASMGGLFYMLQLSTVMSAELYGIDPFNQPGIDSNKQALFAQHGRAGFEDKAKALEEYKAREQKIC